MRYDHLESVQPEMLQLVVCARHFVLDRQAVDSRRKAIFQFGRRYIDRFYMSHHRVNIIEELTRVK